MVQRILGILGWVGTALVFAAVAIRFIRPEWDQYGIWAAWAGLALVLLYTVGQWREIVDYFRRRQARYGAIATVSVLVFLAIIVAINYLSARQNKRWDLTANRQNSLSDQTVKVLQGLDSPAKFTVFEKNTDMERFRTRLNEYGYNSKQVSVEYIDPDTRPVVAKEFDIQQYGTVVIDYKGRRERVTSDSEQDLTNGLIKAVSGKERSVYFIQGHGEKDPTRTERDGYSAVTDALKRDNYKVDKLVLAQQKDVPADATAVIIAGPTSDLLPEELDALKRYLSKAGKLLVLVDPAVSAKDAGLPNLEALLKEWDIELGKNVVVDVSGATNEPSIAVAAGYPTHPITDRFATLTVYPLARSVDVVPAGANGTHGAAGCANKFAQLGRSGPGEPVERQGRRDGTRQGRQGRAGDNCRGRCRRPRRLLRRPRGSLLRRPVLRSPSRGLWSLATLISPPTRTAVWLAIRISSPTP
jgi:ABC-type uncharacterized transport system involved in gliding motility auxiliary subunit